MSTINVGNVNTNSVNGGQIAGFRNKIINGGMVIDQRNSGGSITPTNGQYSLDRWNCQLSQASKYSVQQNAGSVTPPQNFTHYIGATSLSAYSIGASDAFGFLYQTEGYDTAFLNWGRSDAQTATLSFWVRSSLTGTFGGSFRNATAARSYVFSYTIDSANTWEYKEITVTGDTTGTWQTTTSAGILIWFSFGDGSNALTTAGSWNAGNYRSVTGQTNLVGTNGATFYLTGVQLELGSTATTFEQRNIGTELALCQRYGWAANTGPNAPIAVGQAVSTNQAQIFIHPPVTMRVAPTLYAGTAADYDLYNAGGGAIAVTAISNAVSGNKCNLLNVSVSSGLVSGNACEMRCDSAGGSQLFFDAEL